MTPLRLGGKRWIQWSIVGIPDCWKHPQRSPARRAVLLKHSEDERDEAIECDARCKLPGDDNGDTYWNEQEKELDAL